jgi:SnoaL-like domain
MESHWKATGIAYRSTSSGTCSTSIGLSAPIFLPAAICSSTTATPDGVVKDVAGKRWDTEAGGVRGFATHFLTRPNRRGGQHHVQHLFVEPAAGGSCRVVSYWVSIQWDAEGDRKFIRALGSYRDTCVQVGGHWCIKEKIIDPWNSATAPMVGHLP